MKPRLHVHRLQGGDGDWPPDPKHISTSYVERLNLAMRMSMRRFTRLTNAFCKKLENHAAALALYFMYYKFGRIHQTLRVTPSMEAGVANHVWSIEEIVALVDCRTRAADFKTLAFRAARSSLSPVVPCAMSRSTGAWLRKIERLSSLGG